MRKIILAIAALALLSVAPALAQQQDFDPAKFYVHVPIKAEGHDGPMFYSRHPFDTKGACEQFILDGFDRQFIADVGGWAKYEQEAHQGEVEFGDLFCGDALPGVKA